MPISSGEKPNLVTSSDPKTPRLGETIEHQHSAGSKGAARDGAPYNSSVSDFLKNREHIGINSDQSRKKFSVYDKKEDALYL